MKSRILLILAGGVLAASSAVAAPACLASTTVAALVALGAGGADIVFTNDTVNFNNFNSSGSASGASANLDFSNGSGLGGYTFVGSGGSFIGAFVLGYTATITSCDVNFACTISGRVEQSLIPNGGATITITESAGATPAILNIGSQTSITSGLNLGPALTKSASYDGTTTLISYESDIFQTATSTAVPEPVSISMIGVGLVGLGLLGRRRAKK